MSTGSTNGFHNDENDNCDNANNHDDNHHDNKGEGKHDDAQSHTSPFDFLGMFAGNPQDILKNITSSDIGNDLMRNLGHQAPGDSHNLLSGVMQSFRSFMDQPVGSVNWKVAEDVAIHHKEFSRMTRSLREQTNKTSHSALADDTSASSSLVSLPSEEKTNEDEDTIKNDDPPITASIEKEVLDALTLADLWLDPVCDLMPDITERHAWTRKDWVHHTLPVWKEICEPVAKNATKAISEALGEQLERMGLSNAQASATIPEFGQLFGPMNPQELLKKMSAGIFAMQIGQALGMLSQDTFGSTDIGFPLTDTSKETLVWTNIKNFGEGLHIPQHEVLLYLAVREAAYARLYNTVPWLRPHLLNAVKEYASHISIDTDAFDDAVSNMEEQLRDSGLDPQSIEQGFSIDIFSTTHSPDQEASLVKLQTTLAIVEGWIEEITTEATKSFLPHTLQLREMVRRRRFSGTPAEQLLKILVGLEMRPKRVRDAAQLWHQIGSQVGMKERDKLWSHPDVMPTPEELEDPLHFLENREKKTAKEAEADEDLKNMLEGTLGWAKGLDPHQDSEGDTLSQQNKGDSPHHS